MKAKTDYPLLITVLMLLGAMGVVVFGIMPETHRAHAAAAAAPACVAQVYEEECDEGD